MWIRSGARLFCKQMQERDSVVGFEYQGPQTQRRYRLAVGKCLGGARFGRERFALLRGDAARNHRPEAIRSGAGASTYRRVWNGQTTIPLTGLLNHRAFHRRLDEEADRAQRAGRSLAMSPCWIWTTSSFSMMLTGIWPGMTCFGEVADALRANCRSYDTLARFRRR